MLSSQATSVFVCACVHFIVIHKYLAGRTQATLVTATIAQAKWNTVLYGSARTGDYLIVAIKKLQHIPFSWRHDCRLTAACTNETHRRKWVRAHGRLSSPYQCVKPAPSKGIFFCGRGYEHKELVTAMAFKEVYDCEILLSEIEKRLAVYDCSMK
jgi:hypothetical protein